MMQIVGIQETILYDDHRRQKLVDRCNFLQNQHGRARRSKAYICVTLTLSSEESFSISVALTLAIRIVTIPLTGGVSGSGEAADSG